MSDVSVFDAKNRLSALIGQVEAGAPVTITRRGQPVARLVAVASGERGRSAVARLRALRDGIAARGVCLSDEEIRALRDEGRH